MSTRWVTGSPEARTAAAGGVRASTTPMARRARRWVGPTLAFVSAVVAALLAIVTNMATSVVPQSWTWAFNPRLMWSLVAGLMILAAVLAAGMARSPKRAAETAEGDEETEATARAAETTSTGPPISGSGAATVAIEPAASPTAPLPIAPASDAGQIVHGEIPARPAAWQAREEVEALIAAVLADTGVTVVCTTGQRGVGKSQAAAAVAREVAALGWDLVVWVSGESEQALVAGLEPVARELGVHDPDGDSYRSAERLRDHLRARTSPGLVVIDNAEDTDRLRRWLPGTGATRVVVTSTERSMTTLGTVVEIGTYTRERSVEFLRERTGLDDPPGADRVADELGDLPLALAQAASAVLLRDRTYQHYLTRLATTDASVSLIRRDDDPYPRGAAEAILLSIQALEPDAHHSGAAGVRQVLEVVALLDPAGVERDLLDVLFSDLPATGAAAESVEAVIERAVAVSILTWARIGEQSVVMHRLVARVARERAARTAALLPALRRVITGLHTQLVAPDDGAWHRRDPLDQAAGHARSVWTHLHSHAISYGPDDPDTTAHGARLVASAVSYLNATAQHRAAIALGDETHPQIHRLLGEDHPDTLTSANNLAYAYRGAGRLAQALPLYEDTLARRRRLLGDDHPDTLRSVNNLAYAYERAGRLAQALPLYEDTLDRYRRQLGDEDLDTILSASNLAYAYKRAGRLEKALPLYENSLTRYRRQLGEDHSDTLRAAHNLALAYKRAGRLDEALPLLEATHTRYRRLLGRDHSDTLRAAHNLALTYKRAGRGAEAVELLEDTHARYRRLLGDDHPDTRSVRHNLTATAAWRRTTQERDARDQP